MSTQQPAVTAAVTAYGNPYATLTPARTMDLWGRQVYVDTVYWDAAYACYMARGAYARKDGTRGRQRAHAPLSGSTIPADVADALAPLLPADAPQPGPRQDAPRRHGDGSTCPEPDAYARCSSPACDAPLGAAR